MPLGGTNLPIRNVRYTAAFGGKSDIEPTSPDAQSLTLAEMIRLGDRYQSDIAFRPPGCYAPRLKDC